MEKYNNWKLKFYTIWAGQAVSLITSTGLNTKCGMNEM